MLAVAEAIGTTLKVPRWVKPLFWFVLHGVVAHEDGHQKPEASAGRAQETEHRQPRIAQIFEVAGNPHQHRRAQNERRQHQAGRDTVGDLLKPFDQGRFVESIDFELDLDFSLPCPECDSPVPASRAQTPALPAPC